jgi:hypothetical protein
MSVPAWRSDSESDDEIDFEEEFYPGERICAPPTRIGGNRLLRRCVFILLMLGAGWAYLHAPPDWREQLTAGMTAVSSLVATDRAGPVASAATTMPPPAPPAVTEPVPPPEKEIADAPDVKGEVVAAAPVTTGSVDPAAEAPAARLPPPTPDPRDPYQKRAVAVGLHPNISRAVLSRLSATDYRNAGTAIKTAVAKTPDDATFVWPRQRKPELALFEVRFVRGAAPHCRRYVVTVTKDRWSTTAPPMERCS